MVGVAVAHKSRPLHASGCRLALGAVVRRLLLDQIERWEGEKRGSVSERRMMEEGGGGEPGDPFFYRQDEKGHGVIFKELLLPRPLLSGRRY